MEILDFIFLGVDNGIVEILAKLEEIKATYKIFHFRSLEDSFQEYPTPSTIRGSHNISVVQKYCKNLTLSFPDYPCTFYKDKAFYPFTGRKSSMPLMEGEEYFTQTGVYAESLENIGINKANFFTQEVLKITKEKDQGIWKVFFKDGTCQRGKRLICCYPPNFFYQKFDDELGGEIYHKSFKAFKSVGAMTFQVRPKKKFEFESGTIFIPIDQTTPMGHIIADFQIEKQDLRFFCFLAAHEEDNPKLLMDKIKLVKRKIRMVFPALKKEEFPQKLWMLPGIRGNVGFDEQYREVYQQESDIFSNLHFIGPCAPLLAEENSTHLQYFARIAASVHETLGSIL